MADFKFPHIQDSITNFLYDEEGNIPRNKVLTIGAMMIVLGILMSDEAFA
ncbi:His-Xaa-Ser repeat protein HxsA3, partial [Hungatella effluvii]